MLEPPEVKRFYDRMGRWQDRQGFYEDPPLDELFRHADVPASRAVVELGCGTGRFAARVLMAAPAASYVGFDISTTMITLARERLAAFGGRARVELLAPGVVELPLPDRSADRVFSTYVLDLLPADDIATVIREAHRVLVPGGRLCLVSLTPGPTLVSRLVTDVWRGVFRLRPQLVGGCRPIRLAPYCDPGSWEIGHHGAIVSWGVPSEVLIARRRPDSLAETGRPR